MPSPGNLILGLVAVSTTVGGYIFDWNHTHVYNPRWPPHAKFHNGQTMSTGFLLGFTALYYLTWPFSTDPQRSLNLVTWLLCFNCVSQLSAAFYPGALPIDPEFGEGFPQLYICAGLFAVIAAGYGLERSRMARVDTNTKNNRPKAA